VALLSETHLIPHWRFFIQNYHFYRTDRFPGRKGGTAVAVRKGIPPNHANLPPLVSIEATEDCIPICNSEVLHSAVHTSTAHDCNDADITELLVLRHKALMAGDLNAKHPFWNSAVSNPSGAKLLKLLYINELEISSPQCPTHYCTMINGDMLDTVVHKNVRLPEVIVCDILDSDHLPIVFHFIVHVRIRNLSDPDDKFIDLEPFQSLASKLISPKLHINSGERADKAGRDFTTFIASVYRLSTSKSTLSGLNNDLFGLESLLNISGG
jgi:hypothetical protein